MYRTRNILAVLLAFQLLLALGLAGSSDSSPETTMPLVSFDRDAIDTVVLEGPEKKVTLARRDGTWVLPEQNDFPVPDDQVRKLLDRLTELQTRLPVATSAGARKRFRVDDDDFERRITLSGGDTTLARLYLGKSPGMNMIYAREESQNDVHVVKMAAYDVPVEAGDWQDKSLLTLPEKNIRELDLAGLQIARTGTATGTQDQMAPAWEATGLQPGEQLDSDAVNKLAGLLAGLRFDTVLGTEEKEDYGLASPLLELILRTSDSGDAIRYRLGKHSDREVYTLKLSNRPEYFRLPSHTASSLVEAATYQQLVTTDSPEADTDHTEDSAATDTPAD